MIEWTAETIEKLKTIEEVKSLRDNAAKRGNRTVVELCEADLLRRNPPRIKRLRPEEGDENRAGYYVAEFHFVCPKETGVTKHSDGSIRTGTWVVAEANAEAARRYGALVALHATRAEPSYLQGTIRTWEKRPREPRYAEGQLVKTEFGIDFIFEPSSNPMPWVGEGTGEKGYAWAPIPK